MFYFHGTRKPNFKKVSKDIYGDYWKDKGSAMRSKLMEREYVFMDWIKPSSRVLSIGCGNSRLLYELRAQKQCHVFGIDIDRGVVDGLQSKGIGAMVADIARDDFTLNDLFQERFDYVVMSEILEHLVLPERLIEKINPFTEYIVISVPNSAFYRYRTGLLFKGRFFTQWAQHPAEHLRYWSHIDFQDWLEAQKVRLIEACASNGPKILRDIWPNMFGHQICYLGMPNRS